MPLGAALKAGLTAPLPVVKDHDARGRCGRLKPEKCLRSSQT
jgi:hypothetical protein